mmetsp:Transcript_34007/g.36724  ORF Transcript_34007/g.36724 Transcript_34007/m.36724 type:complete len:91 (+) Transcript_34007:501-773(+)
MKNINSIMVVLIDDNNNLALTATFPSHHHQCLFLFIPVRIAQIQNALQREVIILANRLIQATNQLHLEKNRVGLPITASHRRQTPRVDRV